MNLEKGGWQSIGVLALMAGTWQSRGEPRGSKISLATPSTEGALR
jgi:hypothetical protein